MSAHDDEVERVQKRLGPHGGSVHPFEISPDVTTFVGITVRTWLAGQVLPALIATAGSPYEADEDTIARRCLGLADAIIRLSPIPEEEKRRME